MPHALAALDARVVDPDEVLTYDGTGNWPEAARHDQTLASALQHSVVWYFQRMAQRLGAEREAEYLRRFGYGNMDSTGSLTSFWIGGSLQITPEEQAAFWVTLYRHELPIAPSIIDVVLSRLVEPPGVIVTAAGEQPFRPAWPQDAVLTAKPGSATDRSGRGVRWLAGHVQRGTRSYVFVSCVIGTRDVAANDAIDLAARSLAEARVW